MPLDYSVIIVTFNSSSWVGGCLDSLRRAAEGVTRLQLIVVDNASSDGTVDTVRRGHPDVELMVNDVNRGFAAAVNQGASVARNRILLLLNPDCTVEDGFFRAFAEFAAGREDQWVAGSRLIESDGRVQPSSWKSPSLWTVLLESALPYQWSLSLVTERPAAMSQVETISGASLLIPRDLFRRLGGFDERFFMYYEDFDLCMRARGSGVPIYQEPRAIAVHHARQSTTGNRELFFWYVYRSKLMIVQKHGSPAAALLAFIIMLLGLVARIPAYAAAGILLRDPELLHLSKCHTFVLSRFAAFYFSTQHA